MAYGYNYPPRPPRDERVAQFRLPLMGAIFGLGLIVVGWVMAFTGLLAENGLGDSPHTAAALCGSFGVHNANCKTFNALNDIGCLVIIVGIGWLLGVAIRTAMRYRKASER